MMLTESVAAILSRLEENGYPADLVGGGVRDALRGVVSHDFDITTAATPEEIKSVFADCRTVDTGIRHGTVTVLWERVPYEITTWRVDGDYSDHRHPNGVTFTRSLGEDLVRRDFTMNAIAYSPLRGYTDLFGGGEDIRRGIIRAVGDPERRFEEDALRILRALRFAATLDFIIEEETLAAARRCKHLLKEISVERILSEWNRAIAGKAAHRVLAETLDVWEAAIPELSGAKLPDGSRFLNADGKTRTLALFSHLDAPAYAEAMLRLHSDGETRKAGEAVLNAFRSAKTATRVDLLRLLRDLGEENARLTLALRVLLGYDKEERAAALDALIAEKPVYRIADLAVRGSDLAVCGIRGEEIGKTLARLLDGVIDGSVENSKEALLSHCTEN